MTLDREGVLTTQSRHWASNRRLCIGHSAGALPRNWNPKSQTHCVLGRGRSSCRALMVYGSAWVSKRIGLALDDCQSAFVCGPGSPRTDPGFPARCSREICACGFLHGKPHEAPWFHQPAQEIRVRPGLLSAVPSGLICNSVIPDLFFSECIKSADRSALIWTRLFGLRSHLLVLLDRLFGRSRRSCLTQFLPGGTGRFANDQFRLDRYLGWSLGLRRAELLQ